MEAKLIIVVGKANKSEVSLKLPTTVGRSRDADLTIAHPMVSRQHCQLFEDNGVLMVRDLGSLNGTFVRKQRITQPVPLRPNDEFTIGPITFRAEYEHVGEIALPPSMEPVAAAPPTATEQMPDFLTLPEQTPVAGQAASTGEPAPFIPPPPTDFGEMPDFGAWAMAGSGQGAEAAEPTPPSPGVGAPAAPVERQDEAPELEFPEFAPEGKQESVPQGQQDSDFSLGPSQPRAPDVEEMLLADLGAAPAADAPAASVEGGSRPPALPGTAAAPATGLAPADAATDSVEDTVQTEGAANACEPSSPPAKPKDKSPEVNEEDLDDFFKGLL